MVDIKMMKLEELESFDPDYFLGDPVIYGWNGAFSSELVKEAAKLAQGVNGICVAIVKTMCGEEFALSASCSGGRAQRFRFFNAAVCEPLDGEIRVVVHDNDNPDDLIYDEFLMNEQGNYC